jgi:ankyrin repeat protein
MPQERESMSVEQSFWEGVKSGNRKLVSDALVASLWLANARDSNGTPAVLVALYRHHRDIADLLVAMGAEMDLWIGAAIGDLNVIESWAENQPTSVDAISSDGFLPLCLAALFQQHQAVIALLCRNANPSLRSRSMDYLSPLDAAVLGGSVECLKPLLARGAPPNDRNRIGYSPLHLAAQYGRVEMVYPLLQKGASPQILDLKNQTPLQVAEAFGQRAFAQYLREAA